MSGIHVVLGHSVDLSFQQLALVKEEKCAACLPDPSSGDNKKQQGVESSRNSFISLQHAIYKTKPHEFQKEEEED